jgi:hypothetical protein
MGTSGGNVVEYFKEHKINNITVFEDASLCQNSEEYDKPLKQEQSKQNKEEFNKKTIIPYQIIYQWVYLFLDEECRAYLIDLRSDWLSKRPQSWRTSLEVEAKTFIFFLDLYLGLLFSKIKRLVSTARKPML